MQNNIQPARPSEVGLAIGDEDRTEINAHQLQLYERRRQPIQVNIDPKGAVSLSCATFIWHIIVIAMLIVSYSNEWCYLQVNSYKD